jgi:hypothetical protein
MAKNVELFKQASGCKNHCGIFAVGCLINTFHRVVVDLPQLHANHVLIAVTTRLTGSYNVPVDKLQYEFSKSPHMQFTTTELDAAFEYLSTSRFRQTCESSKRINGTSNQKRAQIVHLHTVHC